MLRDIFNKEELSGDNDVNVNNSNNDNNSNNIISKEVHSINIPNDESSLSKKSGDDSTTEKKFDRSEIAELPELIYQMMAYLSSKVHNLLFFTRYYCEDEKLYNQMLKHKKDYDKNLIQIAPDIILKTFISPYMILPTLLISDISTVRIKINVQNPSQMNYMTNENQEKKIEDIKLPSVDDKTKILSPEDFKKLLNL